MDLNQLKRIDQLQHISSLTVEQLYSELPLYKRVLITTCDVEYRDADDDFPQVLVSEDVKRLHEFCKGDNSVMLPCCECKGDRPFEQGRAWNPIKAAEGIQKETPLTKSNRVVVPHQIDQGIMATDEPYYYYGLNCLATGDFSEYDNDTWEEFKQECGNQCKTGILNAIPEFRKDIACTLDANHKGFADFIIVPAVSTKPDELIAYEDRQIKAKARISETDVEQSNVEKEAEKLYNKYCMALLLIKVGQYPAMKDMQLIDTKKYRKILGDDYSNYTLSIALASEGVGIGAFVYLRRILENIVEEVHQQCVSECNERAAEAKEKPECNGKTDTMNADVTIFDETAYQGMHFNEKISYLESSFGKVIIPNEAEPVRSKLYGVISKGIHMSSEDECLELYPSLKYIIEIFLDDKIQKQERQKKLDAAMKAIQSK